jgi:hypothetical protein
MLRIGDTEVIQRSNKRKNKSVNFRDEEEIINLEDIDDTVGRFRNVVQSSVIQPNKKLKTEHLFPSTSSSTSSELTSLTGKNAFDHKNSFLSETLYSKLNFNLPNSAPEVNFESVNNDKSFGTTPLDTQLYNKPKEKKKYVKEAWPGKKPNF